MPEKSTWRGSRRKLLAGGATLGIGALGLGIVGCGGHNSSSATATPAPGGSGSPGPTKASGSFKLTKEVDIGFLSSFSGPLATVYAPFVNGSQLAVDEINKAGGIGGQQVKLIQADDASNPANVPAAALGLVDKKVNFCLGPIGSNAISASPDLNKNKIVQFGYSDNPKLSDPKQFPYSFRYVWSAEQSSKLIVDWYVKQGWTKIAILAENTVYGQTDAPTTKDYMKTVNLNPTIFEYFQSGTSDFSSLLNKAKDAGTQAIVWWTQGGPEGSSVLVSMNSLNMRMPIGGIGLFAYGLVGKIDPAILNQTYAVNWKRTTYNDTDKIPQKMIDFRDKLQQLNQLGPVGTGVSPFYDMVYHLKAAIEGSHSIDSQDVVKWMETHPYNGVMADYTAITPFSHTVSDVNQITLDIVGSFDPTNVPFYKRATGF